jgi:hypothetical protein
MQNWSNPPEIRQKLAARQKYFLPASQLSNLPELCKSGGENRHLATLYQTEADYISYHAANFGENVINTTAATSLVKSVKILLADPVYTKKDHIQEKVKTSFFGFSMLFSC